MVVLLFNNGDKTVERERVLKFVRCNNSNYMGDAI